MVYRDRDLQQIHFKQFPTCTLTVKPYEFANITFKRPFLYRVNHDPKRTYSLGIPLGSGTSCLVRRCWHHEQPDYSKAIKSFQYHFLHRFLLQIHLLKRLDFPLLPDTFEAMEQ